MTFVITNLARYSQDPRQVHENALKRVFRYLKGTRELGLYYDRNDIGLLNGIADASWNVTPEAKSFSGYVVRLGMCLVTWKSKKQSTVALSTCEAETNALVDLVKEIKWIQGLLFEMKANECLSYPVKLYSDSKSAIEISNNAVTHFRTKHFRLFYHFVRDEVSKRNIAIKFVSSEENLADVLTKNVHGVQLINAMQELNVR